MVQESLKHYYEFTPAQEKELLLWAEWLETTGLKQGHCALKIQFNPQKFRYCCLGLYLEKSYGTDCWVAQEVNKENVNFNHYLLFKGKEKFSLLREDEMRLGLHQFFTPDSLVRLQNIFSVLNDKAEFSFEKIAKTIRYLVEKKTFSDEVLSRLKSIKI